MSPAESKRAWRTLPLMLLALAIGSCSDDDGPDPEPVSDGAVSDGAVHSDAGPVVPAQDAGRDGSTGPDIDAGNDAGNVLADASGAVLKACLDRPGELARPPSGELPCELLPPGFSR